MTTYRSILLFCGLLAGFTLRAQEGLQVRAARGTGRTTGHIITLSVRNTGDSPQTLGRASYFIPSTGRHQSYVGHTPEGVIVPPDTTIAVPVVGYCTNVHLPPVPDGGNGTPFNNWVFVGEPEQVMSLVNDGPTTADGTTYLLPAEVAPVFSAGDMPAITQSPGFAPAAGDDEPAALTVTFPGTDTPLGGTLQPDRDPTLYGNLVVAMVEEIIRGAETIQTLQTHPTPFSGDPAAELDALVQQTVWLVMALVTGEDYTKEDFQDNVFNQFTSQTGRAVEDLPEDDQEALEGGVDDFWNAFQAVGVEAKVLIQEGSGEGTPEGGATDEEEEEEPREQCECNEITFNLLIMRGAEEIYSGEVTASKRTTYRPKINVDDFEWGQEYDVTISDIVVDCDCGGDADSPCTAYPPKEVKPNAQGSNEHDETKPGKVGIYIRNDDNDSQDHNVNCDMSEAGWNDDETVFSFKLTTKEENAGAQVSQRFKIKSQCHAEDCRYTLCYRTIHFYLKR